MPASVGKYRDARPRSRSQRGVIYALAPSPLDINRIWAGTDDGLIHVDRRRRRCTGRTSRRRNSEPWAKVSIIDAGHFDAADGVRRDQHAPARRHAPAHLPHARRRQDLDRDRQRHSRRRAGERGARRPKRKGLLFAGTEREVYVSFDDGDHWQSLRLNMPATRCAT